MIRTVATVREDRLIEVDAEVRKSLRPGQRVRLIINDPVDVISKQEPPIKHVGAAAGDSISLRSYGRQWIDDADREAVDAVLRSDFLTQGPRIQAFEEAICEYTGARHCVVVSSATAGLHLAVAALQLDAGEEGITSPNTFVASSNSLVYNGIKPIFADIDDRTLNINPEEIRKRINDKTKVLIPVHFAGRACNMTTIRAIADEYELSVIEDAAHAIGSQYDDGGMIGNCAYSDMTVFSFHPVKTMTTGEGGAITTNKDDLYQHLVMLRNHGITRDAGLMEYNPGPWYYEMQMLGYNYRISDMQAALGLSQMRRLTGFIARRREMVRRYHEVLEGIEWLTTPDQSADAFTCFHLFVLRFNWKILGKDRPLVMATLREMGVGTQVLYIPVHLQPYYRRNYGYKCGDYPVAEAYYQQALAIPLFPAMTDRDQEDVIAAIRGLAH